MTVELDPRAPAARGRFGLYPGVFSPLGRVVLPSLFMGLVFLALAWSAQARAGTLETVLPGHAIAMLLLFWWTVLVCRETWATPGARIIAVVAAVAAVLGPMSPTAAPGRLVLMNSEGSPVWWWSALIAAGELALIAALSGWLPQGHLLAHASSVTASTARMAFASFFAAAFVTLLVVPGWTADPGHGAIPTRMIVGWVGLAAATCVATMATRWGFLRAVVLALPVLTVAGMYAAYNQVGGWPAVPGWGLGAEAPLYATIGTAAVVIIAPILGVAIATLLPRVGLSAATGRHTVPRPIVPL